jgi:hypothetical protein
MTTTPVTGAIPTEAQIADDRRNLVHVGRDYQYPYAFGVLRTVVELLADDHHDCMIAGCPTCLRLRYGLAIIAALHLERPDPAGGAR